MNDVQQQQQQQQNKTKRTSESDRQLGQHNHYNHLFSPTVLPSVSDSRVWGIMQFIWLGI